MFDGCDGVDKKKPTTVSSRGFLSKFQLTTSADGVVAYNNDDQCDLPNVH
jgi:hypothetical protein